MIIKSDKGIHVEYFLMITGLILIEIIFIKNWIGGILPRVIGLSVIISLLILLL